MKNKKPNPPSVRRKWPVDEKINIIKDHFSSSKLVDTCEKYRVHPNLLNNWWKTILEAGAEALSGNGKRENRQKEKIIEKHEKELARKNEVIAELTAQVLNLKKPFGET